MKTLCVHIALIALLWQVTFFSVFCIFLEYNRGDIAEEYCINRFDESSMCVGSCYIATQTVDTFEQQQSDRSSLPLVDIEIMPFSLFCEKGSRIPNHPTVDHFSILISTKKELQARLFISDIFDPPQFFLA